MDAPKHKDYHSAMADTQPDEEKFSLADNRLHLSLFGYDHKGDAQLLEARYIEKPEEQVFEINLRDLPPGGPENFFPTNLKIRRVPGVSS